jgi:hypothetical protein
MIQPLLLKHEISGVVPTQGMYVKIDNDSLWLCYKCYPGSFSMPLISNFRLSDFNLPIFNFPSQSVLAWRIVASPLSSSYPLSLNKLEIPVKSLLCQRSEIDIRGLTLI